MESNTSLVTVTDTGTPVAVTPASASGTGKVTISFAGLFTKTVTVQVEEVLPLITIADTALTPAEKVNNKTDSYAVMIDNATLERNSNVIDLNVAVTNYNSDTFKNFKLTAASDNTSVATVDSAVANVAATDGTETTAFKTKITVKGAGQARITVTANDSLKTAKTITLYVVDPTPLLSDVTINSQSNTGTDLDLYFTNGYVLDTVTLSNNNFRIFGVDEDGKETANAAKIVGYRIGILEGKTVAAGEYKNVTLSGTVKLDAENNAPNFASLNKSFTKMFTVKVTSEAFNPKWIKGTPDGTLNLFYTGDDYYVGVTFKSTKAAIDSVSFNETTYFELAEAKGEDGFYKSGGEVTAYLKLKNNGKLSEETIKKTVMKAKTVTFDVTPLGYATQKGIKVNLKLSYKAPTIKLASSSATYYTNMKTDRNLLVSVASVSDESTVLEENGYKIDLVSKKGAASLKTGSKAYQTEEKAANKFLITVPEAPNTASTAKVNFVKFTNTNWSATDAAVYAKYAINLKTGKNVKLELTNPNNSGKKVSAITLNNNANYAGRESSVIQISVSGGVNLSDEQIEGLTVTGVKNAATYLNKGIQFVRDEADGDNNVKYTVTLTSSSVPKGNYKFEINTGAGTFKAATLTVKVVNTDPSKALKLSSKGKIDILAKSWVNNAVAVDGDTIGGLAANCMIITPKITGFTFTESGNGIDKVTLGGADKDSFTAINMGSYIALTKKLNATGTDAGVKYAKKNTYSLIFTLKLDNGVELTASKEFKFKMSQGKLSISKQEVQLASGGVKSVTLTPHHDYTLYTTANVKGTKIKGIMDDDDGFGTEFTISNLAQLSQSGAVKIEALHGFSTTGKVNAIAQSVKPGKSYNVKVSLHMNDQATDVKDATTTIKVKIAK